MTLASTTWKRGSHVGGGKKNVTILQSHVSPRIRALADEIGYPNDADLTTLVQSLTHVSFSRYYGTTSSSFVCGSRSTNPHYQCLELVGDAVIALIVREFSIKSNKDKKEGVLAGIQDGLVNTSHLARIAKERGLDKLIRLPNKIYMNEKIMCDVYEAVTGAIYLDLGLERSRVWIRKDMGIFIINGLIPEQSINHVGILQSIFIRNVH